MASIDKRLKELEKRNLRSKEESVRQAREAVFEWCTDEELDWLEEPFKQAAELVQCPKWGPKRCDCMCSPRIKSGLESYPELQEEMNRRWAALIRAFEEDTTRGADGMM